MVHENRRTPCPPFGLRQTLVIVRPTKTRIHLHAATTFVPPAAERVCGDRETRRLDRARVIERVSTVSRVAFVRERRDTPLRIRLVIPGPFDTDIWDRPGSDPAVFRDEPKFPPEDCAAGIIAAITGDAFEHYVPDMKAIAEFKTSNIEQFLSGVASSAPRSA